MIQRLIPTYLAKSAYDIPADFYQRIHKKVILFDLDNTLDSIDISHPSIHAKTLINSLKSAGLDVYIASNNTKKRVLRYCKPLEINGISCLLKPFSFKLKKWLKSKGYKLEEVIFIGDQIFTDVLAAKGAKIDVILTNPLSEKDSIFTFFNRKIEKNVRKKIEKNNLSKRWEEIAL